MAAASGLSDAVALAESASAGGFSLGKLVLDRGSVGVRRLAQAVVVLAQDLLSGGGGFVEGGLACLGLLAHLLAELLVDEAVSERWRGWRGGRVGLPLGGDGGRFGVGRLGGDGGPDADFEGADGVGAGRVELGEDGTLLQAELGGPAGESAVTRRVRVSALNPAGYQCAAGSAPTSLAQLSRMVPWAVPSAQPRAEAMEGITEARAEGSRASRPARAIC